VTTASASGKLILFGEHAVVYGRPALAAPLSDLRARVRVENGGERGVIIRARDLNRTIVLGAAPADDPLAAITRAALGKLRADATVSLDLWIESDIPLASGLGSGAAVSTAIVRALAAHLGQPLSPEQISALVFETEKLYHGTPSGIDNTVIALERPIRFTRESSAQPIRFARPLTLAIANTGIESPTRIAVGDVRRGWQLDPARYEGIFDGIAAVVKRAEEALTQGSTDQLGTLMNRNQDLLRALDVSSPEIERLLRSALDAGAVGGKLSGGGRGGNVMIYMGDRDPGAIMQALLQAGAAGVLATTIRPSGEPLTE
jgi:mevalonate kinase